MHPAFPIEHLNDIIAEFKPGVILTAVEPVPNAYLLRLFNIALPDSTTVLLSLPPSPGVRLLRQERNLMRSQASLLTYLHKPHLLSKNVIYTQGSSLNSNDTYQRLSTSADHVPKLLEYHMQSQGSTIPYIISTATAGSPLSSISLYLTLAERRSINEQLVILSDTLSTITSPNGNFGLAADVLSSLLTTPPLSSPPIAKAITSATSPSHSPKPSEHGNPSWTQTFLILMESSMRDAEDMLVNIPYHDIRRYLGMYSHYLDDVKVPKLVVMRLGDEENVLVVQERDGGTSMNEGRSVRVAGLRDWSGGIFGDGELGAVESGNVDDEDEDEVEVATERNAKSEAGLLSRKFRRLMYVCYKAVVMISTEYQRPRPDSMRRDDEARMKLTAALRKLKDINAVLRTKE